MEWIGIRIESRLK